MTDMETNMTLKKIGRNTYCIESDTNIGIYKTGPDRVCLIDAGSKGDGEKIDEILMAQGWELDFIINTHSHVDHVGGNRYLMEKYRVPAYCAEIDKVFAEYSDLESSYMNGGKPASKLRHMFAHPGKIGFVSIEETDIVKSRNHDILYEFEFKVLPGHSFGMIGIKTPDDIWFLGDAYLSEAYMQKHNFGYLVDVGEYIATLEMLKGLEGKLFVPSHGVIEENICRILDMNIANQKMLIKAVKDTCVNAGLDEILRHMYGVTKIRNNEANHALLSSTVKCYLTYLQDNGEIECGFVDNVMVWKTI